MHSYESPVTFHAALRAADRAASEAQKFIFCQEELPRYIDAIAQPPTAPYDGKTSVFVDLDDAQLQYQHLHHVINGHRFHWGQLKLFAGELEFLATTVRVHGYDLFKHLDCIVYAGAADGKHTPAIIELFPPVVWQLYDPAPFDAGLHEIARKNPRVKLHNCYFDNAIAESYRGKRILFISDVRRVDQRSNRNSDRLKREDHALQAEWVRIMTPIATMLKFSPPYVTTPGTTEKMRYFDGLIMNQVHAGDNSTECRMMFSGIPDEVDYDTADFEAVMCYQNRVRREADFSERMQFDVAGRHWNVDISKIAHPAFIGHDTWRLNQILLMFVLTRHASVIWARDPNRSAAHGFDRDRRITRDNWDHIPAELVADVTIVDRVMDQVLAKFFEHHVSFATWVVRHTINRSNWSGGMPPRPL